MAEPMSILYVPSKHCKQEPLSDPVYPCLHRQLDKSQLAPEEIELSRHPKQVLTVVAPVLVEYVMAPQSLHAAEPGPSLYFPVSHKTQFPPSAPVAPALQVQILRRAYCAGELEYAGHSWQDELPSSTHEPAKHGRHVSTLVARTVSE